MPYSLVGTPALGYDLARSARGDQAAVVVRTALRCSTRDLHLLACRHRGRDAVEAPALAEPTSLTQCLGHADEAVRRAQEGDIVGSAELLGQLESARIGGIDAADRFLRHDVLGWCWSGSLELEASASLAADVLRDAAAPAFSDDLTPRQRRELALPFLGSGVRQADGSALTGHDGVDAMLATLSGLDAEQRTAWRQQTDVSRPLSTTWAPAMHEATWALHISDRLRLAADVQMAAVLAFRAAGFDARDAAYGVWNSISGALQATVVSDLLPQAEHDRLMRVWRLVHDRTETSA